METDDLLSDSEAAPGVRAARRAQLLHDRELAAARRRRRGLGVRAPSSMPVPSGSDDVPEQLAG